MHRPPMIYWLAGLVLCVLFFPGASVIHAQNNGQILGRVSTAGGQGINGISLTIYQQVPGNPAAWSEFAHTTTAANGDYTVSALAAGIYRVYAYSISELYFPEYYGTNGQVGQPINITVNAGATVTDINIVLTPTGSIRGTVTDHTGAPLTNMRANLLRENQDFVVRSTRTGSDGSFTLGGLYTGTYHVYVDDPAFSPNYEAQYYDHVRERTAATLISITAGQVVENINVQLNPLGEIAGRVTDQGGTPLTNIRITGERQRIDGSGVHWDQLDYIALSDQGQYALDGIPAGVYRIRFHDGDALPVYATTYYGDVYDPAAATLLTITSGSLITNVNAQLGLRGSISGRVTNVEGQGLGGQLIRASYDNPLDPGQGYWVDVMHNTSTDSDGNYTFCCLDPIPHRILFDAGGYLPEYYHNAHTAAAATVVPVTAGATTPNIDAQLEGYSTIVGKVTEGQGIPLSDILVTLYQPSTTTAGEWTTVASVQTEAISSGAYAFAKLAPGPYRLGFTDLYASPRYLDEFYHNAPNLATATTISLTANLRTRIDVTLTSVSSITGTLTDPFGDPLADMWIVAFETDHPENIPDLPISASFSDVNGHYRLEGLSGGTYIVAFSDAWLPNAISNPNEKVFEYYADALTPATATVITVPSGTHRQQLNAQLTPKSWIQGVVTDQQGDVLTGVKVEFQRYVAASQSWQVESTIQSGITGYRSALLPAGRYRVYFGGNNPAYKPEYYNNVYYADLATSLVLTTGKAYSRINAVLESTAVNAAPRALPDAITAPAGQLTATLGKFPSVLANDLDFEGTPLSALVATTPAHGTLSMGIDGHFTYQHHGDSADHDFFTYRAHDGVTQSEPATVTITISPTAALASFVFSKTVSIAGITPTCTPVTQIKVPVETAIVYCYTVRNTGSIPLTTHSLRDSHLGQLLTNAPQAVAPGAQYAVAFTQTLTVNTTNIATWTATTTAGQAYLSPSTGPTVQKAATVIISGPNDDQDGDTIPDNLERAGDLDDDNMPNFLDTDADGDGTLDRMEAGPDPHNPIDSDQDGIPDYLDSVTLPTSYKLYVPIVSE